MQHLTEEQLVLFHYGEGDADEELLRHLSACPGCRTNYDNLRHALGSVTRTQVPEPPSDYGTQVWQRLAPQLARKAGQARGTSNPARGGFAFFHDLLRAWAAVQSPRRGWVGAGLAALVILAFLAGRFWPQPISAPRQASRSVAPPPAGGSAPGIPFRDLGDHLERSQLALLELINSRTNGAVDLSIEQVLARELIDVNRIFCRTAAQLGDGGATMNALEDLERSLLEISNSPPHLSAEQFAQLRSRIGPDAVLCKIKVVSAQVRAKENAAAHARNSS